VSAPSDVGGVDSEVAADTGPADDTAEPPLDTGPVKHCTLDNGSDPVALCTQKLLIQDWHDAAFAKATGVAESWSSDSFLPDKDASGAVYHVPSDDLGYALSLARYQLSAARYGDTEIDGFVRDQLTQIMTLVNAELTTAPDDYDGELYALARNTAGALRAVGRSTDAGKLDVLADAIGASILAHFHPLVSPSPGGDAGPDAGDGGSDAGDATVADTSVADTKADSDAADVGPPLGDGILGVPASGGGFTYSTASVATGAFALIDMATHHADDKAAVDRYQRAAASSLEHIFRNAREPATGLYYRTLVASDGVADTLAAAPTPNDLLSSDVQATVALSLSRAQELVTANKALFPVIAGYPFDAHAAAALASANGTHSLWDDAGTKGYFDGWVPSTGEVQTHKSTRANARMFAALHRISLTIGTPLSSQGKALRTVLVDTTPLHVGLLSIVESQVGWFTSVPAAFDWGAEGTGPREKSYFSAANIAAFDALWEQWFGLPI
jgi:hypothetical protein